MAEVSSPRAGGEVNSEPTTEKRKRAHTDAVVLREESLMTSAHESDEDKTFIVRMANCGAREMLFTNAQCRRPASHDRKCRRDDGIFDPSSSCCKFRASNWRQPRRERTNARFGKPSKPVETSSTIEQRIDTGIPEESSFFGNIARSHP